MSLLAVFLFSCGGQFSKKPPLHPNLNMDNQPKRKSQTLSLLLPIGVVPYGREANPLARTREALLKPNMEFYYGLKMKRFTEMSPELMKKTREVLMDKNNPSSNKIIGGVEFTKNMPLPVTKKYIIRGFRQFQIYCAMCHGIRGLGNGLIVERRVGVPPPPNFASKASRDLSDGKIFNIITHGRPANGMPAHAAQLYPADRWAIVMYIRTLQRAMNGRDADIPAENRK